MKLKKKNKKGFTLAELLIVVAIIAVLVAIAIPVFTSQLEKSRESTDAANVRSAYAEVVTKYLSDGTSDGMSVEARQQQSGWQTSPQPTLVYQGNGAQEELPFSAHVKGESYKVNISVDETTGVATPTVE